MLLGQSSIGVQMPTLEIVSNSTPNNLTIALDTEAKVDSTAVAAPIPSVSIMAAPKVYDYHALGMFCKFDVGLDKGSKIPLRFRLGTVGAVDELERKGPTRYNY